MQMSERMKKYIQEDIEELEKLKKKIPAGENYSKELMDYMDMFQLFTTTLKMAVINGTLSEVDAEILKRKYAKYKEDSDD